MGRPLKTGGTYEENLRVAAERTGEYIPQLVAPYLMEEAVDLWVTFWKLFSGQVITYSEIESYQKVIGLRLTAWEVETLRFLSSDAAALLAPKIGETDG
jgi:hypothetical protein